MMICKKCKGNTKVTGTIQGETVERYRKCVDCGAVYNTIEMIAYDPLTKELSKRAFSINDKLKHYIPK